MAYQGFVWVSKINNAWIIQTNLYINIMFNEWRVKYSSVEFMASFHPVWEAMSKLNARRGKIALMHKKVTKWSSKMRQMGKEY